MGVTTEPRAAVDTWQRHYWLGLTDHQRTILEGRLLDHVRRVGTVPTASQAVSGAHINKQIGLRVFATLTQRGVLQRVDGGFVVADDAVPRGGTDVPGGS